MMSPVDQKQSSTTFSSSSYQLPLGASITKNKLKRELSNASTNSAGRNGLNKFQLEGSKDWLEDYKQNHIDLSDYNRTQFFSSMSSMGDDLAKNNKVTTEQNNSRIKSTDKESATSDADATAKNIAEVREDIAAIKNIMIPPSKDWIGKYKNTHVELKDYNNLKLFHSEDKVKPSNESLHKMNVAPMTAGKQRPKNSADWEAEFYSNFVKTGATPMSVSSSSDSRKKDDPKENDISDVQASAKSSSNDGTSKATKSTKSNWAEDYYSSLGASYASSTTKTSTTSELSPLPTSGGNSNAAVAAAMKAMMGNNKKSTNVDDSVTLKKSGDNDLQIKDIPSTNELIQNLFQPMPSSSSSMMMIKSQDDQIILTPESNSSSRVPRKPKDGADGILKSGDSSFPKFGSISLRTDSIGSLGTDSVFGSLLPSLGRANITTSILSDIKSFTVPSSTDSIISFKLTPSMDADMKNLLEIPISSLDTTAKIAAEKVAIPPTEDKKPILTSSLKKQDKENNPLDLSEIKSMVSTIEFLAEKNKQEAAQKKNKKKEETQKKTAHQRTISKRNREPEIKIYVERPTNEDVLLGRGGKSNNHPGNVTYRNHVGEAREVYRASEKNEKTDQAQLLVDWVTARGGRFLKRDPTAGNKWYIVTNLVARRKASQALREHMTMEERKLARKPAQQHS